MTDRTEHYLKRLMDNPGKWVRITKLKRQVEARDNTQERQQLMLQIEAALNLMSIRFKKKHQFKIMVVEEPKGITALEVGEKLHMDFGKVDFNVFYGVKLNGKKLETIIYDDVIEVK